MFVRRKRSVKKGPTEKQSYVPRYQANISPQWPLLTQEKEFRFALAQLEQFGYCRKTMISTINLPQYQYIYVGQEHVLTPPSATQITQAATFDTRMKPLSLDILYVDYFCGSFGRANLAIYIDNAVVRDDNLNAGTYTDHSQSYTVNTYQVLYIFNNGNDGICLYQDSNNNMRIIHGQCNIYLFGNLMNEQVHLVRVPKDYVDI